MALCVDFSAALNEWDPSSPLILVSIALCVCCFLESDWNCLVLEQDLTRLAKATAWPPGAAAANSGFAS